MNILHHRSTKGGCKWVKGLDKRSFTASEVQNPPAMQFGATVAWLSHTLQWFALFLFLLLSIWNTCLPSIHLSPSSHPSTCLRRFDRQTHFSIHLDLPQRLQPITKIPWRYRSSTMVEQQDGAVTVSLSTGMLPTPEVSARLNPNTMSLLYLICTVIVPSCTHLSSS